MENTAMTVAAMAADDKARAIEIGRAIHAVGEERFEALYRKALEQNPKLAECTVESLIGALLQTLHLGLGLEHVILTPATHDGVITCKFGLLYKGYVELAKRVDDKSPDHACNSVASDIKRLFHENDGDKRVDLLAKIGTYLYRAINTLAGEYYLEKGMRLEAAMRGKGRI
jgi:hypothetical protein